MAEYWIDYVAGDDSNAGTSSAAAKKTLKGFATAPTITLADDDVVNLVNSGPHELPLTANEVTISKRVTIRGRTAAGAAAQTTISSTSDSTARRYVVVTAGGEVTFENITLDFTATTADTDAYDFLRYNGASATQQFRGCSFKFAALGSALPSGQRRCFNTVSASAGVTTVSYYRCYFQNTPTPASIGGTTNQSWDECVFIGDQGSLAWINKNLTAGAGGSLSVTKCTWYVDAGTAAVGTPITYTMNGASGALTAHSNLVWMDSSNASTLISFVRDSATSLATVSGTRGYNVLLGGPNVASAADIYANGWYEKNWDPDQDDSTGDDTYPTDQTDYAVAAATMFNAPASTYAWSTVNGLSLTLPKDLRPRLYLTAAMDGGVVGALPAAQTDYGVALVVDNTAPSIGDTVTLILTASNDGTDATDVSVTLEVPDGLTLVDADPSAGSYDSDTGVWTIGSMADASTELLTLTLTVDSDQGGNTITATATTTSGDPASDTNPDNDLSSVSLAVYVQPTQDPTQTPYLDVAPIYAPVLLSEIHVGLRIVHNRFTYFEKRHDIERHRWHEAGTRRLTLAPSETHEVITAIERLAHVLIEADADIQVSASNNDTDAYTPNVQTYVVLNGDLTTLKLKNPSASDSVDVLLTVID